MHDLAREIAKSVHSLHPGASNVVTSAGLTPPGDWKGLVDRLHLLCDINAILERYQEEIFSHDLERLQSDLAPAARSLKHVWAVATSSTYRAARRTARALRRDAPVSAADLLDDVRQAADIDSRWKRLRAGDSRPARTGEAERVRNGADALGKHLERLFAIFPGRDWRHEPLDRLRADLDGFAADSTTPFHVVRVRELERELREKDVGALLDDIRAAKAPASSREARFRSAWLRSCLDAVQVADPELARFKGVTHQKVRPASAGRVTNADATGLHVGPASEQRGLRRPSIPRRDSIDEYSNAELDRIVQWVSSSSLKTDDEIVAEVTRELGFMRRGTRIETAIRAAIARVGGGGGARLT